MQINLTPEIISLGVALLGSVITGAFTAGRLYSKIKRNTEDIEKNSNNLEAHIKDNSEVLRNMSTKLDMLVGKVSVIMKDTMADDLSVSRSPRQLNELGLKVLKDSSIEQVIEPKFDYIIEELKGQNPQNPYQAQEALFDIVQHFKEDEGLLPAIENGAFLSGRTPEEVLYVGALNIRDRVIEKLGLEVGDIDKHDPKHKTK